MFAADQNETSTDSSASVPMNFASLSETLAQGGAHLGDVVWWTLADADIDRLILEAKWAMAGLDAKLLPSPQTPEKALRLAVNAALVGVKGRMIKNTLDTKTTMVFAVVKDITDDKGNYDSSQETLIHLDRTTTPHTLTIDDATNEIAKRVVAEYHRYLNIHTSRDVMMTIIKTLKTFKAVTLRDTGGIYWVPRTQAENLRSLKGAIEGLGGSRMYLLPVHETSEAASSLGAAAAGSIEAELAGLREEIDAFVADPDLTRPSTLERRLEAFTELRSRASLYQSILHVTVSDLDGQINGMEDSVRGLLAMKDAAKKS